MNVKEWHMAYKDLPPLTDADGEAREVTAEDFVWAVETSDFPDHNAAIAFLMRREELFKVAEASGLERDVFLPFEPSKPGFEDRLRAALESLLEATKSPVKHAAE